jgi:two-component sensor histidine kinase
MALHELMTNAAKYGALKQHFTILAENGQPWLHLDWKESGAEMPPLGTRPQGSAQGRELIERVLPYQFDAQTTFVMEADGIQCTISLPSRRCYGRSSRETLRIAQVRQNVRNLVLRR